MRILVAPAGSRGDFQPLLALAVGLRKAGHDVLVIASPNFASEVAAFGIPFRAIGFDVEAYMREIHFDGSPLRATYEVLKACRQQAAGLIGEAIPLARGADVMVGGGAQIAAPTVAESAGVPYLYVAYTPQAFRSSWHPPLTLPLHGLPRPLNRLLWSLSTGLLGTVIGGPLNRERRALRLAPVVDWYEHFFPRRGTILAADPELAPPAPDSPLALPPTGAWQLADDRPLGQDLESFLEAGAPPVYAGFGSMPDGRAARTTRLFVEVARTLGVRLVLSRGWAGYGLEARGGAPGTDAHLLGENVLSIGPASHSLLLPRVAAIVHHGGAGTTAAAARAGRPQVVVPHAFDQFQWARWVHAAGLGPSPIPRGRLTARRLAEALRAALGDDRCSRSAAAMAARIRERDSIAAGVAALEKLTADATAPRRFASAGSARIGSPP